MSDRKCRVCGCTDARACICEGLPCCWVEEDLCSACATPAELVRSEQGRAWYERFVARMRERLSKRRLAVTKPT